MAYIYKIINKKNNKIYIGKTEFSIEKRWKEHLRDSKKNLDRPLYRAMNKYGIENFDIEQVEKTDSPVEREQYWIEYYGSFKYGYNATLNEVSQKMEDKRPELAEIDSNTADIFIEDINTNLNKLQFLKKLY